MSKKRKNVSDTEVTSETETSEDTETSDVTTELDTNETTLSDTSLSQNEGNTMANEDNVGSASTYTQVAMARLYNRNDYPVTLDTTDGNQLVLSPRQKTEPLEAHLLIESEFPSGIIKIES